MLERSAGSLEVVGGSRRKLIGWLTLIGVIIALNYAANFTQQKNTGTLYDYSYAVSSAVLYAIWIAIVLGIVGHSWGLLALRRPSSPLLAMALAAAVLAVSILVIDIVLEPFLHGGREQGLVPKYWEPAHEWAFAANWFVIAAVDPVVEELTYRGLGFSLLFARIGKWGAIVAVGLLFAASHGLVQAFPELALLGAGLAWLRWRTGSVYPSMVVHSLFNSIALALVILTAQTAPHRSTSHAAAHAAQPRPSTLPASALDRPWALETLAAGGWAKSSDERSASG